MYPHSQINHLFNLSFIVIVEKKEMIYLTGHESVRRLQQRQDKTQQMTFLYLLPNLNYKGLNLVA